MEELKQLLRQFNAQQQQTIATGMNSIGFILKGVGSDLQNQRHTFAARLEKIVSELQPKQPEG